MHYLLPIFKTKILPKIEQIVKETVDVVSDKIMCPNIVEDYKCYKMIGYDILGDKNYNLYLAEINTRLISLKYPPPYFKKEFYCRMVSGKNGMGSTSTWISKYTCKST